MDVTNTRLTDEDRRVIAKARALAETIGHDDTADALGYGHGLDSAILWPAAFAVAQTALDKLAAIIARLDAGDA